MFFCTRWHGGFSAATVWPVISAAVAVAKLEERWCHPLVVAERTMAMHRSRALDGAQVVAAKRVGGNRMIAGETRKGSGIQKKLEPPLLAHGVGRCRKDERGTRQGAGTSDTNLL